jgi:phospho-N-acetylmuramoyl-pentapeptide-transferase
VKQFIRKEGPTTHEKKLNIPTLGGLGFLFVVILMNFKTLLSPFWIFLLGGFLIIGISDDVLKLSRKENLGLTFWQKIGLQVFFSVLASVFLILGNHHLGVTGILSFFGFNNPLLYLLFTSFIFVATANASNLTDGLDGLLAGCMTFSLLSYGMIGLKYNFPIESLVFSLIGALLAFLIFNFPKAKIFMGDVGSLSLGVILAGIAVVTHNELLLIIIGGIYVIEALSVIIQVISYKYFRKRIFLMSPIHHHFELLGVNEIDIVVVFWFLSLLLGVIGFILA